MFSHELRKILAKDDDEKIALHKVTFMPMNVTLEFGKNRSILNLARKNQIHIKSVCHGQASCAECVIKVLEGEKNLNRSEYAETKLIGNVTHITHERLSCQCIPKFGDIVIDVSRHIAAEESVQVLETDLKKKAQERDSYVRGKRVNPEELRRKQIELANRMLDEKKIREEDEK